MRYVPVISFYPEDLPHFSELLAGTLTQAQLSDRVHALADKLYRFFPEWDRPIEDLREAAITVNALVYTNSRDGVPILHLLIRPSQTMSLVESISFLTGLRHDHISPSITKAEYDFIVTQHEIGHMEIFWGRYNHLQGSDTETRYQNESFADGYGLYQFAARDGRYKAQQDYVHIRRIGSFLFQPPEYFLGPNVENAMRSDEGYSLQQVWQTYMELRLRTGDELSGARHFQDVRSQEFVLALNIFDARKTGMFPHLAGHPLLDAFAEAEHTFNAQAAKNSTDALKALGIVIGNSNVSNSIGYEGEKIMAAVHAIAPGLLGPPPAAPYRHHDARVLPGL
jgi:hypothetical protein